MDCPLRAAVPTYNLLAHTFVAFAGYAMFGGLKLFRRLIDGATCRGRPLDGPFDRCHWITMAVIAALIVA
jgi:hypothetical protein